MGVQSQKRWNIQSKIGCSRLQPSTRVDVTENFTTLVSDVTFRVALTRMMMEELNCMLTDVETAFLYGESEEEIYMVVPVGMKDVFSDPEDTDENTSYPLLKGIYMVMRISKTILVKGCEPNYKN